MTPEEILRKHYTEYFKNSFPAERLEWAVDVVLTIKEEKKAILSAMEDYAAQQAQPLVEALNESIEAMNWMWNNLVLPPEKEHLQSDAFNIPANAINMAQNAVDPYLPPVKPDQYPDGIPF